MRIAALVAAALALVSIYFLRPVAEQVSPPPPAPESIDLPQAAAPAPVPEPPSPVAPTPPETSFTRRLRETLASLPTREEMRRLSPEELHRTPKALIRAGAEIGAIEKAIKGDPSLAPEALEFYGRCAGGDTLDTAVRALCLANGRALSGGGIDESTLSPEIRRLADKLTKK